MKKRGLLNAELSRVVATLGHTDGLMIADAGLPIPDCVTRVDLALTAGIPSFMQVLEAVTHEMQVEHVIIAEEIKQVNGLVLNQILACIQQLEVSQGSTITVEFVTHEAFKANTTQCRAVVRSGECSPYANVILRSGVVF